MIMHLVKYLYIIKIIVKIFFKINILYKTQKMKKQNNKMITLKAKKIVTTYGSY